MSAVLPLFPLGTVLFPGLLLPLRVFEPRYRALVRDLMTQPADVTREFGVVTIRRGWEVATGTPAGQLVADDSPTLYEIGCAAEIRQIDEQPDGQFEIVTVGRRRFRLLRVEPTSAPYPVADVEWLTEPTGTPPEGAHELAAKVGAAFLRYLRLLSPAGGGDEQSAPLPEHPTVLSHLIAATVSLPIEERQRLLAAPDAVSRLRAEWTLLRREAALLSQVRAVPIPLADLGVTNAPN